MRNLNHAECQLLSQPRQVRAEPAARAVSAAASGVEVELLLVLETELAAGILTVPDVEPKPKNVPLRGSSWHSSWAAPGPVAVARAVTHYQASRPQCRKFH